MSWLKGLWRAIGALLAIIGVIFIVLWFAELIGEWW